MRLNPKRPITIAALAVALVSCHLVSGVDKLRDEPAGSGGLQGAGGNGGAPNVTVSSAGPGGTGGSGTGGSAGCEFGVIGSCGPGQKCALVDDDAGPAGGTACISPGSKPSYVPCDNSDECEDGLFCNREWQVCQPICNVAGDCASGGLCEPAWGPADMVVPGVKTCSANCIPNSGFPCNATHGAIACVNTLDDTWECMPGGGLMKGDNCAAANDCALGLGCFGSGPYVCRQWCSPASDTGVDASCPLAELCYTLVSSPAFHNGTEYGVCI